MAWTGTQGSAIFQQAMLNPLLGKAFGTASPTGFGSLTADTINVALFGNTGTPDKAATAAFSGYGIASSQWVVANETNGGANWPAGGLPLGTKTIVLDATSSSVCFCNPSLSGTGNVTVTNAYGCLVYDNTISAPSKQGLCFNYFGGAQGVTAGTFTVIWASVNGNSTIFNVTV